MSKFEIKLSETEVVELEADRILANDVTFHGEYNPHNVRPWIIGNEYGAICLVWADCEQDALDIGVDENLLDTFLVSEQDIEPDGEYTRLGNAGEACDLTYAWIKTVDLAKQDLKLLLRFAEARGGNYPNLDF